MIRVLMLLALLAVALEARAQGVYRWVMPDGTIRYSDQPVEEGAVEGGAVSVSPVQTYTSEPLPVPPPKPAPQPEQPRRAAFAGYDSFSVVTPLDGEAVRVNSGDLPVQVALRPALADGHVVVVRVDGAAVREGRATEFVLAEVDRGMHVIDAVVEDEAGEQVAATAPVTVTLLRTSRCDRRREDFAGCEPKGPCSCGSPQATPFR